MQCKEFREKYQISEECCESCHEDDSMGFGEDLWFAVEGKDWNICCSMFKEYELRSIKKAHETSKQ
jgi:hypothetical protein